jgi:SAM-dependent methyltransferase
MSDVIEPAIVLAAYAEPVASGRRVLFVGPASSALPARLVERGARLVHVCDPEPVRLAEATAKNRTSSISFSALADGHFALRDGAFDLCIIEDAGISDPVPLLKRVRRALTPRGVLLMASLNPEARSPLMPYRPSGVIALDYYALYDAVKAEFEQVRMLGQAPFVGYVVADFAPEGTPEPSLDTAFLPGGAEEPELFIAVGSDQPVDLEAFSVVQLPYRSVVSGNQQDSEALRRSRGAEQQARTKLTELESELAKERQAIATRDAKLREAETRVFARDAELAGLRHELENKNQLLKQQEASLSELNAKLKQGPSPEEASAAARDLAALEQALTERGEHVRKLERELREAERIGKELVRQLPGATAESAGGTLAKPENAETLAQQLAKSHADLIATRWALEAAVRRGGSTAENPES